MIMLLLIFVRTSLHAGMVSLSSFIASLSNIEIQMSNVASADEWKHASIRKAKNNVVYTKTG
jgi:hypothetical protein